MKAKYLGPDKALQGQIAIVRWHNGRLMFWHENVWIYAYPKDWEILEEVD